MCLLDLLRWSRSPASKFQRRTPRRGNLRARCLPLSRQRTIQRLRTRSKCTLMAASRLENTGEQGGSPGVRGVAARCSPRTSPQVGGELTGEWCFVGDRGVGGTFPEALRTCWTSCGVTCGSSRRADARPQDAQGGGRAQQRLGRIDQAGDADERLGQLRVAGGARLEPAHIPVRAAPSRRSGTLHFGHGQVGTDGEFPRRVDHSRERAKDASPRSGWFRPAAWCAQRQCLQGRHGHALP